MDWRSGGSGPLTSRRAQGASIEAWADEGTNLGRELEGAPGEVLTAADARTFPVGSAATPGTIRSEWGWSTAGRSGSAIGSSKPRTWGGGGGQIRAQSG